MTRSRLVLLALFVLSASAFAGRPVKEYSEPNTIIYQPKRGKLSGYAESPDITPDEPFPWLFIGLAVLLIAGAAPFALRAFRQVEQEHLESLEANVSVAEKRAAAKQLKPERKPEE